MLKYVYWHIIIYFVPNLFSKILLLYKLICIFACNFKTETITMKAKPFVKWVGGKTWNTITR